MTDHSAIPGEEHGGPPDGSPADTGEPGDPAQANPPAVPERPETEPGPRPVAEGDEPGTHEAAEAETGEAPEEGEDDEATWEELAAGDPRSRAELLAELTAAEEDRDEYLDALQRARAEFDNYRKRMMREGTAQREAGKADVAEALLDVLDDFDRTLQAADTGDEAGGGGEDDSLVKGVELVHGKLMDALKAVGLARIGEAGEPFDPTLHEAVQQREAPEGEEPEQARVAEVLRPGYQMAGRVIRAAMVIVEQ